MSEISIHQQSSLEKIFPDMTEFPPEYSSACALRGERFSYQLALKRRGWGLRQHQWHLKAPPEFSPKVYLVEPVPCGLAAYPGEDYQDGDYLSLSGGLFPDVLRPIEPGPLELSAFQNITLWVELEVPPQCPAGTYEFTCSVEGDKPGETAERSFTLEVSPAQLPPQKLLYTQWFHLDCLADWYGTPVYSERHWKLIERYLATAAAHGLNTVLTPVLTPALDTEVGTERPCTQLLDIEKQGDTYRFDFTRLSRFVSLAQRCGVTHFEISPLFTQWGAAFAPNIYVKENGTRRRAFGWETAADSPAYVNFLRQMVPALIGFFTERNLRDRILFHLSDEPGEQHLAMYEKNEALVRSLTQGLPIIDALSSVEFYDRGTVQNPVVATNHIAPFLSRGIENLWAYYCCAQGKDVGNRFLAMPSYRNRILGQQFYKFHLQGFLHWGYNFWYAQNSRRKIDPYRTTDGGGAFPGGDPFSVYPGEDGFPVCSLRFKVFYEALQDQRALELLETLTDRETAESMIENYSELAFDRYPKSAEALLAPRERVNQAIKTAVAQTTK